jgi:hypothetical protein
MPGIGVSPRERSVMGRSSAAPRSSQIVPAAVSILADPKTQHDGFD